jgi:1-deoxy-D-xylulose-5-phosphate reductoisomerase
MKKISILGSTGSIGVSTLDICRQHADRFSVVALAAGSNTDVLLKQINEFHPQLVSVKSETEYNAIKDRLPDGTELMFGESGAIEVAKHVEVELVVSAIVGAAGLTPTLSAIKAGKTIALANKESMVIAGELMSSWAKQYKVKILPVDSEHSAIFQCLNGESLEDVKDLILTASGGPFWEKPIEEFGSITKAEALNHPNWDMGEKITIDSASMMNKGLEVMEARWLFDLPVEKIRVVVHPQSIIHSMVEFIDASVMAQLGEPDMRVPIAYALSYPRRISTNVKSLSLPEKQQLTFYAPNTSKFKCLKLAFDVAHQGKSYAPVLNAANEVAVNKFLAEQIGFVKIGELIDDCLQQHEAFELKGIEDVLAADQWARRFVEQHI